MVTGETSKAISKQPKRIKHIPKRTCIGCRETKAKRELIRIISTLQGNVEVDLTGKKLGRGAYLCHQETCWDMGLKKNRLDKRVHFHIQKVYNHIQKVYGNLK